MPSISVSATIYVPAEVCFMFCRQGMADERWRAAYRSLRPGREFSAEIVGEEPHRLLRFAIGGLASPRGKAYKSLGFEIEYRFTDQGAGATFVEIEYEYGVGAAVAAAGTMAHQAGNDALHRLAALLALEAGYAIGRGERTEDDGSDQPMDLLEARLTTPAPTQTPPHKEPVRDRSQRGRR